MKYLSSLATIVLLSAACGEKDTNNTVPPPRKDMTQSETDMGDAGADPLAGCVGAEDLDGVALELFKRELGASDGNALASCGPDIADAETDGTWVGLLLYDDATNVEIKVDGLPRPDDELNFPPAPVWEVRRADCTEGDALDCSDARAKNFQLEADVPYFIVVNGRLDSGGVQIQVSASTQVCDANVTSCTDGVQSICNSVGTDFRSATCVAECAGTEGCAADACSDALRIELVPNAAPTALNASRRAYTSTWTADNLPECNPFDAGVGGATDNVEFFVVFGGLTAGQQLVLDAEGSEGDMGFFVLPECAPTSCTAAYVFDQSNLNRAVHTVEADGDLLVAFEALGDDLDREIYITASLLE